MAINIENPNEFIMKKNLLWHHNLPLDDIGKAMDEARTEGYKQGQKDSAKQIFADLKTAAWQQIEPDKLKQFYKEFSEAKDEKAALEIAKKYTIVGFSAEKFDAIKKKYGVLK